jgi:nuclear transport factor 2 (NTF2) superfamily protein
MTIQSEIHEIAFPTGEDPWTWDQAEALIRLVEDMFHRVDVNALVNGFTEDCVFRFADQPEQRGREALRKLFSARLARQQDYRLKKTVLAIEGNRLANKWEGTWTDRNTGKDMAGFGVEVWVMRDGKIADWQAAFNVWEAGGERGSSVM